MTTGAQQVNTQAQRIPAQPAELADAGAIAALINEWAAQGLTLARSEREVADAIEQFVIVRDDEGVAACGALVEWPPRIAEIRSVSVAARARGNGAGRAVVKALIEKAERLGIDTLVLLTKTPGFFERCGFEVIPAEELPPTFIALAIDGQGRSMAGRIAMRLATP